MRIVHVGVGGGPSAAMAWAARSSKGFFRSLNCCSAKRIFEVDMSCTIRQGSGRALKRYSAVSSSVKRKKEDKKKRNRNRHKINKTRATPRSRDGMNEIREQTNKKNEKEKDTYHNRMSQPK